MKEKPQTGLMTVAIGYGLPETLTTLSYLNAYGIYTSATPLHMSILSSYYMIGLGGIQINVPVQQYSHALELLMSAEEASNTKEKVSKQPLTWAKKLFIVTLFLFTHIPWPDTGLAIIRRKHLLNKYNKV